MKYRTRKNKYNIVPCFTKLNRVCGLVVRVPGYWSRGPGFVSRRYQIFREVVGLERGPLSLVSITEELLERKNSCSEFRNVTLNMCVCTSTYEPCSYHCWQLSNIHTTFHMLFNSYNNVIGKIKTWLEGQTNNVVSLMGQEIHTPILPNNSGELARYYISICSFWMLTFDAVLWESYILFRERERTQYEIWSKSINPTVLELGDDTTYSRSMFRYKQCEAG
jgi:hypothetical protein